MGKFNFWIKKNFGLLSEQECIDLKLKFVCNIYGDYINLYNCRSIWKDERGKTFRCKQLINR